MTLGPLRSLPFPLPRSRVVAYVGSARNRERVEAGLLKQHLEACEAGSRGTRLARCERSRQAVKAAARFQPWQAPSERSPRSAPTGPRARPRLPERASRQAPSARARLSGRRTPFSKPTRRRPCVAPSSGSRKAVCLRPAAPASECTGRSSSPRPGRRSTRSRVGPADTAQQVRCRAAAVRRSSSSP
jgi:hypothetical protein